MAFLDEPAAPQHVAMPEMPEIFSQPLGGLHEHHVHEPRVHESRKAADPMPYLAQLTPFSTPATRTEEQPQVDGESREKNRRKSSFDGKKVLQDGAKVAAPGLGQTRWHWLLPPTASVRDHFEEYKKRAGGAPQTRGQQHAARLLDLEQRRAEAQQRATELEAAREAAAARLVELVRQRDPGLPKEKPAEGRPKAKGKLATRALAAATMA